MTALRIARASASSRSPRSSERGGAPALGAVTAPAGDGVFVPRDWRSATPTTPATASTAAAPTTVTTLVRALIRPPRVPAPYRRPPSQILYRYILERHAE